MRKTVNCGAPIARSLAAAELGPDHDHHSARSARRVLRRITTAFAAAVVVPALCVLGAGTAHADTYDWNPWNDSYSGGPTLFEDMYCIAHWGACSAAQDAAAWAASVTAWKFPGDGAHNDAADAFRHCSWSGAMTQRLGYSQAVEILSNHESNPSEPTDEYDMDISNNAVGATIGNRANDEGGSDTWGWIMNQCQTLAQSDQLTTIG